MSSTPNLVATRERENRRGTAQHTPVAETWPFEARALLVVVVFTIGIGLMTLCRDSGSSSKNAFMVAPKLVLDPNSAPPQVLEALPTLGPALVRRWVAARSERPISSLADARRRVRGLGPASLAQIAPYLKFESESAPPSNEGETPVFGGSERGSIETADIAGERVDRLIGRR
jgi:competence protein ComEA